MHFIIPNTIHNPNTFHNLNIIHNFTSYNTISTTILNFNIVHSTILILFHNPTIYSLLACFSIIFIFVLVLIDTSGPTRICAELICPTTSISFSIIFNSGLVHIDTSDPIRNHADLVCHATQSPWCI